MHFDSKATLSIFSHYQISEAGSNPRLYETAPSGSAALVSLLEDKVSSAVATDEGGLRLTFETGTVLDVFDTSDQFESFTIAKGDSNLIVV